MKNYICINGKKVPLTEEQLEQLGLKIEPTILWKVEEDRFGNIVYTCPNCGHCFKIMPSVSKNTIMKNHRYCGHCGVNLVYDDVEE